MLQDLKMVVRRVFFKYHNYDDFFKGFIENTYN